MAVTMNTVLSSVQSLMQMFSGKAQAFVSEIDNVHMIWLEEIQQEANRMFTRDFNAEPELMPKTPSQKRNTRRKRVSLGRQEESQARRRFSKGRRSNLRGSSSNSLNCITEEENASQESTSKTESTRPKRATRKKQTKADEEETIQTVRRSSTKSEKVVTVEAEAIEIVEDEVMEQKETDVEEEKPSSTIESPKNSISSKVVVAISPQDRLSAELAVKAETSPGHADTEVEAAASAQSNKSRQSSVRPSLKLRHSVAGLRHSLTQESVRRASRRSMLKRKAARTGNSTSGSNTGDDTCMDSVDEESEAMETADPTEPAQDSVQSQENTEEMACANEAMPPPVHAVGRITRSVAANSPKLAPKPLFVVNIGTPDKQRVTAEKQHTASGHRLSTKRKAPDVEESPTKRTSPPKKSHSAIRPHMKSFLHTVQKNQMLMMTPSSLGRATVLKSFIKHTTPLKIDQKTSSSIVTKERHKLEALRKKQEQEIERMKKMEEEKKKKQDELKKKRDERYRRVFEAKVKEEQKEEEKKKKIEQKMAHIDEKNDKRQADEKKKKALAIKRQEELELKKKQEEEAKKKKLQQEEEKRQQEAKKKAEEEERALKLAEAHRALELKREQERERERQAAAERERLEREKALAQQRELEQAAREKERRELEEKRKALEERRKLEQQLRLAAEEKAAREREAAKKRAAPALNVTVDLEQSVLRTPVGKEGGVLNQTVDIDHSVMTTPAGKGAGGNRLNVTVDIEKSPQSYSITPKGGNKVPSKNSEDYGMDQNSDDSTDDESAPRKPIPSWAEGHNLQLLIKKQYFNPPDLDAFLGKVEPPNLEKIFYKSKPRYFKRTSSAVWHSPPGGGK